MLNCLLVIVLIFANYRSYFCPYFVRIIPQHTLQQLNKSTKRETRRAAILVSGYIYQDVLLAGKRIPAGTPRAAVLAEFK